MSDRRHWKLAAWFESKGLSTIQSVGIIALLFAFLLLLYFLQYQLSRLAVHPATPPFAVSVQTKEALVSFVPEFFLAAVSQPVQPSPLRKMVEWHTDEEEEEENQDGLVVMDRVVVIPKTIVKQAVAVVKNPDIKAALKNKLQKNTGQEKSVSDKGAKELYRIQLIASRDPNKLRRFILKHKLLGQARIRETQSQGLTWFILTMGEYKDADKARQALQQLPADLAQLKPWVRVIA